MNRVRPVRVSKARQLHAAAAQHKPGKPFNGPNMTPQRAASEKKSARKVTRARKVAKTA